MKNLLYLVLTSCILFIGACTDPCDDVDCGPNGTCDDGTCLCDAAYSGSACEIENRSFLYGTYVEQSFTCSSSTFVPIGQLIIAGGNVLDPNEVSVTLQTTNQSYGPFDGVSSDDGTSFQCTGSFFGTMITFDGSTNVAGELEVNIKFDTDTFSTDCDYVMVKR